MPEDVLSPETTPTATVAPEPHPAPVEPAIPSPAPTPPVEPAFVADILPPAEPEGKPPEPAQEAVPEPAAEPEPKPHAKPRKKAAPKVEAAKPEAAPPEAPVAEQPKAEEPAQPEAEAAPPPPPVPESNKRWYAVKVQSGREETIKDSIERRVKIEGLEEFYGQILVPVERVQEIKNGKRVVKERKKFPGYLMAEVEYNDRILYLFRETSGVGDFVGGNSNSNMKRDPPPLTPKEIERMLGGIPGKEEKSLPDVAPFEKADRVTVKDGIFAGMEGEVKEVLETKGQIRVELTIFGRPTSVELEYWQVEQL